MVDLKSIWNDFRISGQNSLYFYCYEKFNLISYLKFLFIQFFSNSRRTYYSNVDESSSTNSMVKSNTIPRRTNYYHEQFELPHQYYKSNKKLIDPRHGSCRAYAVDSCCDNDSQNTENLDINHATNRAPLLPPIGRNSRYF